MSIVTLRCVEDLDLPQFEIRFRKEHVLKWYHSHRTRKE